ncbi:MAG: phytoene/squalene synthase family protein [Chthoniobacterales bacterium]
MSTHTPEELLARAGKSFHLAGKFLPAERRRAATQLYAFCRGLDDLADETSDVAQIEAVASALENRDTSHPLAALYLTLDEPDPDPEPAIALARALRDDTGPTEIADERALLRYCHGVAGTVGLMMARVLGATNPAASWHAIDLGIALQLTNIARDTREDADHGRRYIPATFLNAPPSSIRSAPDTVHQAALRCLALAEPYYASGIAGLVYLPSESRRGILVAARIYREIGEELQRRGPHRTEDRVVVPAWRKATLVAGILLGGSPWPNEKPAHDIALHKELDHLVGAHS